MNNKVLIKASAGTGKTFSLATHAIRLMLIGTPPRAIVGLTFSRAAAGEIFNGIAKRLGEAALNDAGARKETAHVMKRLDASWAQAIWQTWVAEGLVAGAAADRHLTARVYALLLRSFVHEQHVSRIGTIDSFMAQMVKAFPVELGLEGSMAVMDDFETNQQKRAAADALLAATGGDEDSQTIIDEFRLATVGKEAKCFCDNLDEFVKYSHVTFLQHPEAAKWGTPATIWGSAGIPYRELGKVGEFADRIETQIIASLKGEDARRLPAGWPAVVKFIRGFTGSLTEAPTPFDNMVATWDKKGCFSEFKCNRVSTALSPEDAKLMSACLETLFHIVLSIRCGRTQGIYRLMKRLDTIYAQNTRQRGRLTFSDIPRMIAQLGEVSRLNLEYRFDGDLRHWALDEFQDTSCEQWEAIHNLVEEAKMDPERSVFMVGDMKQAIYGWRGGDVAIFEREVASGCYVEQNMATSHRYCQEIADFVNEVFGGEKIANFLTGSDAEAAGQKWQALWLKHESVSKTKGCVTVARVRKAVPRVEAAWEPFVEPLCADLLRIRPWERGLSAAVLVSKNDHGEALADALRKAGVPVTWEGESDIADTPVVQVFLNLLRVVEHPADTLAWAHICASPLMASKLFADLRSGPDGRDLKERVILKVTTDVSRLGLARTLREYADAVGGTYDAFTRSRIDGLVRAAAEYAAVATAEMSLTDFADYVEAYRTRAAADTSVVKIVTVHRSKGLGFDYVLVPVIDTQAITTLNNQRTFHAPDWAWLMDQPPAGAAITCDPVLSAAKTAEVTASVFEDLCGYYVSLTRAVRAMSVYLRTGGDKKANEKDFNFSNYVERALEKPFPVVIGDPAWYEGITLKADDAQAVELPRLERRPRVTVQRATPSKLGHANGSDSNLFKVKEAGAAERGIRIHALLSKVEWLDGIDATSEIVAACGEIGIDLGRPSAFRDALMRPAGAVEVWRERNFEMLADGQWTSGTFDRVVFTRQAGEWGAAIYDYKSNRKSNGESDAAFESRMTEAYAPQMAAYRQAVAKLAGISQERISASLLLTETLSCVPVV
ncbi:MAG: UvrD-helicase domain-containing protein [bacterium]